MTEPGHGSILCTPSLFVDFTARRPRSIYNHRKCISNPLSYLECLNWYVMAAYSISSLNTSECIAMSCSDIVSLGVLGASQGTNSLEKRGLLQHL